MCESHPHRLHPVGRTIRSTISKLLCYCSSCISQRRDTHKIIICQTNISASEYRKESLYTMVMYHHQLLHIRKSTAAVSKVRVQHLSISTVNSTVTPPGNNFCVLS
mgnify:CR=1 FL=1